jgi:hypothetical protein
MSAPFFITGYPRSRTAWASVWLTTDRSVCLHDGIAGCESFHDFRQKMDVRQPFVGDSDSGLPFIYRQCLELWPNAKWVVLDRSKNECLKSFRRAFPGVPKESLKTQLDTLETMIGRMCMEVKAMIVGYDQLDDADCAEAVWGHCLPDVPFDVERWRALCRLNISLEPKRALNEMAGSAIATAALLKECA